MSTLKILSIDFDYIMYPCIRLYNDYVKGDDNQTEIWQRLEAEKNLKDFICYDAKALQILTDKLFTIIKNNPNAIFIPITEHQDVAEDLKNRPTFADEKYELTNIDFHHDILYSNLDIPNILDFDRITCANWVGYLMVQEKIEGPVTWVAAPGSSNVFIDAEIPNYKVADNIFNYNKITLSDFDENQSFDRIYFCESPQWVPYQFHHLYEMIANIATKFAAQIPVIGTEEYITGQEKIAENLEEPEEKEKVEVVE